jgi:hypothetical protein
MGDTKTRTVTVHALDGREVDVIVPTGLSPDSIKSMLRQRRPDLFQVQPPGMPPNRPVEMKESLAPKIVRGAASSLPVVGGIAGGISGAPAAGVGAPIGAGAGAALGEVGREQINESVFGDKRMTGKESAKNIGLAGGTAAAMEGIGGAAIGLGRQVIKRIAMSKSPQEVGSVVESLLREHPAGFSAKALQRDLVTSYRRLSSEIGQVFRGSTASAPIDLSLQGSYRDAQTANSAVRGVARSFDRIVQAAKINSGIKGPTATPQQLFNFMREIGRAAYREGRPGPVAELLKNLQSKAYADVGQSLRMISPESNPILKQLTNLHAAQNAIKTYKPNVAESMLTSSALHPRTTAAASPVVTSAIALGSGKARDTARAAAQELVP